MCAEMCSVLGDGLGRVAAQHVPGDVELACGEAVGGQEHAQGRLRLRGLDDDGDVGVRTQAQWDACRLSQPPVAARTRRLGGRSAVARAAATEYTLTGSGSRVEPCPMSGSRASASAVLATNSICSSSSTTPGRFGVGRGPVQQDGLAQGVRDVRGDAADDVGLGGGEAERAVLAVQAQVAPAVAADDQRGAQLVAEPDRAHDVAVARRSSPARLGWRCPATGRARARAPGRERVDVPAAQLVVEKQRGHRDERLLAVRAGEQQRLRIGGREERGVDRHRRRSAASTCRCSSSTSSPLRQTRITARSALRCRPCRQCRRGRAAAEPHFVGMVPRVAQGRSFSA